MTAMTAYSHLASGERDRIAVMRCQGFGCRSIARQLNRSAATISREVRRNALGGGAYRPSIADGGYLLRRQRAAVLETDAKLAAYVTDRLAEVDSSAKCNGSSKPDLDVPAKL